MNEKMDGLPKIIFPYSEIQSYNAKEIIKELNEVGLYNSTP